MRTTKGDLLNLALEGNFDVIVHGANCFHCMGGGIALQIARNFPEAVEADHATVRGMKGKLGTISHVEVVRKDVRFVVVNAYTQYEPGRNCDYQAIESAFSIIKKEFTGQRIGYPFIGAGIAGGDWKIISEIIDTELYGENHTAVEFSN